MSFISCQERSIHKSLRLAALNDLLEYVQRVLHAANARLNFHSVKLISFDISLAIPEFSSLHSST